DLPRELGLVRGPLLVELQRPLEGLAQADQVVRLAGVIAPIDGAVGVHEEDHPGLAPVELEEREVQSPALDDADADEALHGFRELGILAAGHLPVNRAAGLSGDAAE